MSRETELENQLENLRSEKRDSDAKWCSDTTVWLRDVSIKLDAISQEQVVCKGHMEVITTSVQVIVEDLKKTNAVLTGNGTPEKGLVVRVDRLEISKKNQGRLFWLMVTGVVGAIISWVWDFFTNNPPNVHP